MLQLSALGADLRLADASDWSVSLLEKYASAENVQIDIF